MNSGIKTPQEICNRISEDFKVKHITHADAAERLGVTRSVVTNQLSGKRYFGKKTAALYSSAFGYNKVFLQHGIGYLYGDSEMDVIMDNPLLSAEDKEMQLHEREVVYKSMQELSLDETKHPIEVELQALRILTASQQRQIAEQQQTIQRLLAKIESLLPTT